MIRNRLFIHASFYANLPPILFLFICNQYDGWGTNPLNQREKKAMSSPQTAWDKVVQQPEEPLKDDHNGEASTVKIMLPQIIQTIHNTIEGHKSSSFWLFE